MNFSQFIGPRVRTAGVALGLGAAAVGNMANPSSVAGGPARTPLSPTSAGVPQRLAQAEPVPAPTTPTVPVPPIAGTGPAALPEELPALPTINQEQVIRQQQRGPELVLPQQQSTDSLFQSPGDARRDDGRQLTAPDSATEGGAIIVMSPSTQDLELFSRLDFISSALPQRYGIKNLDFTHPKNATAGETKRAFARHFENLAKAIDASQGRFPPGYGYTTIYPLGVIPLANYQKTPDDDLSDSLSTLMAAIGGSEGDPYARMLGIRILDRVEYLEGITNQQLGFPADPSKVPVETRR